MAEAGRQRLLQLPRRPDQPSRALRLPLLRHRPLAANAQPGVRATGRNHRERAGLGDQAVAGLIAWAPELGRIRNEAAAALIGAARLRRRQRRMQRPAIKGGRRKLRNLLYMPVMGAATQHNPVIKAYYQRLRSPRASKPRSL